MKVDDSGKSKHTKFEPISTDEGEYLKIPKRDLQWKSTGDHEHHYMPDFSDEEEDFIALTCAVKGCIHGILVRKEGKFFTGWLKKHRAKA